MLKKEIITIKILRKILFISLIIKYYGVRVNILNMTETMITVLN